MFVLFASKQNKITNLARKLCLIMSSIYRVSHKGWDCKDDLAYF